jgi:predicted nucleic acid-binding protein
VNPYLDSSSLLKLFLEEAGSTFVEDLVNEAMQCATSVVAWPESRAGLARAHRSGRLTDDEYGTAVRDLTFFWERGHLIDLTPHLAIHAGDLAARYFLRGLDAIHLASALTLQEGLGEAVSFSSFVERLNKAAADCGLNVV